MYRLLGFKSVKNTKLILKRPNIIESRNQNVSILFNRNPSQLLFPAGANLRIYSSSGLSAKKLSLLTKTKKKKHRKYTELLQVSTKVKETTTEVHKMNAKKLSDFINETSFTSFSKNFEPHKLKTDALQILGEDLDQPIVFVGDNVKELKLTDEGLQEIMESFHAFRDNMTSDEIGETAFVEDEIIEEHELLPEPTTQKASITSTSSKKKNKYFKSVEMERLSREKSLAMSLFAYLDCCVQNGMVNRGYLSLMNCRAKYRRMPIKGIKVTDIRLYNLLIQGYTEKMNLQKVDELMSIIKEDKILPNEQTFANYLECLGRLSKNPQAMEKYEIKSMDTMLKIIKDAIKNAVDHKFSLNSVVCNSIMVKSQRETILHVIRLVEPNFQPAYTPPDFLYNNKILNGLNVNVQPISYNPLEKLNKKVRGAEIMESKSGFTREELDTFARDQLETEMNGYVTIKSIHKFPELTQQIITKRIKVTELEKSWRERIMLSFNRDLNTLRHQESCKARGDQNLLPYLRCIDIEDFTSIVLREAKRLCEGSETYSPTVVQLYKALGKMVESKYQMEKKKRLGILQKTGEIYGELCDILVAQNSSDNPRQCWQRLVYQKSNEGPSMNYVTRSWPVGAKISVGRFLYNIMLRDLKVDVNSLRTSKQKVENLSPAFYTLFRNQGKFLREEVKPHPFLSKLYRGSQPETLTFEVDQVPMLCPPQPWTTSRNGGYLIAHSELMRLPFSAHQQIDRIDSEPLNQLYPALDSLNQLSSIAWVVNTDVLDIVLKVFKSGGNHKLDVPPLPSSLEPPPSLDEATVSKEEKMKHYQLKMQHRRKQSEMYSLWCDALYRLSLANHYRDRVFWLPHNMDFRGRVYPIPPHLNHLGSDLARSLLVFHKKKKFGVDGFSWLKLHCINLTGLKKRDSVRERLLYAEEVMDEILDSADNPLDGRMWWTKSDEPWQTLSCCIEIAKVFRSGDPENYESCLPIHQDGSCNGLQHYAALGRDADGAYSVNLSPADVPQDVYSQIGERVEQARQMDEENGVEIARVLRGFVKRKVIKQTVMTTVYGVTRYGARLQIAKQLKAIDDFPQEHVWQASSYLTNKTFGSLGEMFTSTTEIQDWLTDCARQISSVGGHNVEWVTPLGLPVVQPYNRSEKAKPDNKSTKLDAVTMIDTYQKPNIMKQKNAFPPNFIHSLDSSHMMLTSLFCEKAGLTFISVHDCYWTHACTVPEMNKMCREQFVSLHSQPILEDLSKHLIHKYSFKKKDFLNDGSVDDMAKKKLNRILTSVPEKGSFDLLNVLKSIYFFS